MLGGVQRSICKFNQIALKLGVGVVNGDPDTYCEMLNFVRGAGKKFCLFHSAPQPLCDVERSHLGGFGQNDDEFLSAVPRHCVNFPHVFHEYGTDIAQHLIAHMVAESVIQALKVVDIDHEQRELLLAALSAFELELELLFKVTARPQTGQIIGKSET